MHSPIGDFGILTEEYIFYHKINSDIFHLNIFISNIQHPIIIEGRYEFWYAVYSIQ